MQLVIGTDEAGYGPNIGPLVITATGWLLEDSDGYSKPFSKPGLPDLFQYFSHLFCSLDEPAGDRIPIGDSKKIYQSGNGLSGLERAVLPLAGFDEGENRKSQRTWENLLDSFLARESFFQAADILPWYRDFNPVLPIDLDPLHLASQRSFLESPSPARGKLLKPVSRIIEPFEFNRRCRELGNKSTLLSRTTLEVIRDLVTQANSIYPIHGIHIQCDKHGGRNHYAGMIQSVFEDCWVQVDSESRERSCYRLQQDGTSYHFEFVARGDSLFPSIALSSMVSKYLREICMMALNRFWQCRKKELLPTAGYPADARRFRQEIADSLPELGLQESDWWRER